MPIENYSDDGVKIGDARTDGYSKVHNVIPKKFGRVVGAYGIAVYVLLCSYAGVKKQAWPSRKTLADQLHISEDTLDRAITALIKAGLLKKKLRNRPDGSQTSNMYVLIDPPDNISGEYLFPLKRGGAAIGGGGRGAANGGAGEPPLAGPIEQDTDGRIKPSAENPADGVRNSPEKTADGKHVNGRKKDFKPAGTSQGEPPRNNPQDDLSPSGFFQDAAGDSDKPTYPEIAAGRLWEIASKSRQLDRRSSRIKWAATIRRWIVESDTDINEFETELVWYEQHHGEEFVPQAYSAETFCRKFMDIRRARFRNAKKNGEMTVEERQENTAMHGGYDPLAETPISIIRREDQTPEMREWGDFNRNCPGHDLSLIQFTKLRKHFSGLSHMEIDDFCIKKRPDELWAYADSLPD